MWAHFSWIIHVKSSARHACPQMRGTKPKFRWRITVGYDHGRLNDRAMSIFETLFLIKNEKITQMYCVIFFLAWAYRKRFPKIDESNLFSRLVWIVRWLFVRRILNLLFYFDIRFNLRQRFFCFIGPRNLQRRLFGEPIGCGCCILAVFSEDLNPFNANGFDRRTICIITVTQHSKSFRID